MTSVRLRRVKLSPTASLVGISVMGGLLQKAIGRIRTSMIRRAPKRNEAAPKKQNRETCLSEWINTGTKYWPLSGTLKYPSAIIRLSRIYAWWKLNRKYRVASGHFKTLKSLLVSAPISQRNGNREWGRGRPWQRHLKTPTSAASPLESKFLSVQSNSYQSPSSNSANCLNFPFNTAWSK